MERLSQRALILVKFIFSVKAWTGFSLAPLVMLAVVLAEGTAPAVAQSQPSSQSSSPCPKPALSRVVRHRVASGETLNSIAQRYNLLPTTLMGLNPSLQQGNAPVGSEILIPPFNGIRVNVPRGSSWRDIAKQYGVRADLLFEANGCQNAPTVVFVPGVNWSPVSTPARTVSSPIERYPLPEVASVLQAYGWQVSPTTNTLMFHSGVNLAANAGTKVLAAGAGTVAFAGEQGDYGPLVVINHAQGLQTRYSQLATIAVRTGQQVQSGAIIGTIAPASSQPYLHFEVRSNSQLGWVAQDPGAYLQELRVGRTPRR